MSIQPADRLKKIPPYPFAIVGKRIRELQAQGHTVTRLDMGSPDMPPPDAVIKKLHSSSSQADKHGYGGFTGTPALRQAFADYYARRFNVSLDPDTEVLPLIGSKEGIVNIALAFLNPGDVVLAPNPGYPAYAKGGILAGAEPYSLRLDPDNNYQPDFDSIPADILKRARMMWINYPNNPTGAVASIEELERIVDFCIENDILLCADNPYADVAFDGTKAPSLLEIERARDISVEFNSLSKMYNMAGWRVGVCVGNAEMISPLLRVKSNIDSGLFKSVQEASTFALNETSEDWIAERNAVYQRRRDIIIEALPRVGLSAPAPKAGLYVWAKVDDGDDISYVEDARNEAHISFAAGSFFGEMGKGYIRISLIIDEDRLVGVMDNLADWYAKRSS